MESSNLIIGQYRDYVDSRRQIILEKEEICYVCRPKAFSFAQDHGKPGGKPYNEPAIRRMKLFLSVLQLQKHAGDIDTRLVSVNRPTVPPPRWNKRSAWLILVNVIMHTYPCMWQNDGLS